MVMAGGAFGIAVGTSTNSIPAGMFCGFGMVLFGLFVGGKLGLISWPTERRTVGDLARKVAAHNMGVLIRENGAVRTREVWQAFTRSRVK